MLQLTKIFHFEMAHAIYGYKGACKNIHGHSYKLYVTVGTGKKVQGYIPSPGFVVDFKEIKKVVASVVIDVFDHKLVLSREYLAKFPEFNSQENIFMMEAEPTAENMLIYMRSILSKKLDPSIKLIELRLYETKNSYAKWINTNFDN